MSSMQVRAMDGKTIAHLISLPVIETAGIYTSVVMIRTDSFNNRAAGIANLSMLAVNAGAGAFTMFGGSENYDRWRRIHRILGITTTAAALWMSISAGVDDNLADRDKYVGAGYAVLTTIPVFMFSF
jgi:hypothetical protein